MQISPFKIERYFARYEFSVDFVLCGSDCESMAIEDLLAFEPDAVDRFHRQWLGYTESQGSPSLRREICKIYRDMAPEQIMVHTGAEEAIFLFMHAMLSPEDHVIVHWPCYQSLVEVARSIGCEVTLWKAAEENGWALDPAEFLAELALRHRMALVDRTQKIISENLNVLDPFFGRYADRFAWQRPKAGAIGFPKLLGEGVEFFCDFLVKTAGVLLLPGTVYDDPGNHFRIGFGRKNLPEAIGRLEDFIERR